MQDHHSLIEKLRQLRTEFADRLERIRRDRHHVEGPVSADSEEQVVDRENDEVLARLEATTAADLRQMDHALERVQAGLYPQCEVCGDRIEFERLSAMPFATVCASCAKKASSTKARKRKTKTIA